MSREPFWHWPSWRLLGETVLLGTAVAAWWLLIYGGANLVTDRHTFRLRVHLPVETQVPFVPAAVLGYMSIYPLFWLAPFILRTRRELAALCSTLAAVIFVAGVCFVLLPVGNAFPSQPDALGMWTPFVVAAKRLAMSHNWLPSLHVAMSVVCVAIYARRAGRLGAAILWSWSALIAASTLLLHQHYLIDVATGYLLGVGGVRLGYGSWIRVMDDVSDLRDAKTNIEH
jgi:membrane-associated phospholipid phosphatase